MLNLKIKNFQAHKDTEIEFSPGITVITGESDVGKSSIIRSLEWVATNRPSGDSMRRHNTSKTEVSLNGVTKTRTSSTHKYQVNGDTFKALRSDVPEQVSTELNLTPVNFQPQHQPYFLIADSPGQRARTLNTAADLEIIDKSLKIARSDCHTLRASIEARKVSVKELEESVEELNWVEGAVALSSRVDAADGTALGLSLGHAALLESISRCRDAEFDIPDPSSDLDSLSQVNLDTSEIVELESRIQDVADCEFDIPDPSSDLDSLSQVNLDTSEIVELESRIQDVADCEFDLPDLTGARGSLTKVIEDLDTAAGVIKALEGLDARRIVTDHQAAEREVTAQTSIRDEWLKDIGLCPVCGGEL